MRKLFLTSFEFRTNESTHDIEYRLVVVSEKHTSDEHAREIASEKFEKWFKVNYPNSELFQFIVHPAIDDVSFQSDDRSERERVIDWLINDIDPNTTNGSVILSYLKRNRSKQVD